MNTVMPRRLLLMATALLSIVLAGCISTPSQVELSGQAIDITTGKPIPDVYVTISQGGEHPLKWVPDRPSRWGYVSFGGSMVKTDADGRFHYKSPKRFNILRDRRANVSWYHPCYRSPTSHRTPYSYYTIFEDRKTLVLQEERSKVGAVQKELVLKLWPESQAMVYNDGAEFDPEYGSRRGLKLTARDFYLDNLGVAFGRYFEGARPALKVAWAVFEADYSRSQQLAKQYIFSKEGIQPIPENEPFSPFDCTRPIEAQLPAVLDHAEEELKPKAALLSQHYRPGTHFTRQPEPFETLFKHRVDVLEALKIIAEKEGWTLELNDREGSDETTD